MVPEQKNSGVKVVPPNNLYTAILALAFGVVLATVVFVAYKCYFQYGTLWPIQ